MIVMLGFKPGLLLQKVTHLHEKQKQGIHMQRKRGDGKNMYQNTNSILSWCGRIIGYFYLLCYFLNFL